MREYGSPNESGRTEKEREAEQHSSRLLFPTPAAPTSSWSPRSRRTLHRSISSNALSGLAVGARLARGVTDPIPDERDQSIRLATETAWVIFGKQRRVTFPSAEVLRDSAAIGPDNWRAEASACEGTLRAYLPQAVLLPSGTSFSGKTRRILRRKGTVAAHAGPLPAPTSAQHSGLAGRSIFT